MVVTRACCDNSSFALRKLSFSIRPNHWRLIMAHRFRLCFSSIDLRKTGAFQTYRTKNQPVKKKYVCLSVCLSVCQYVCLYVCLSGSSSPVFSVSICSDHHQIWQVCSLIHNLELIILLFRKFHFYRFYWTFVFMRLSRFLWLNADHVQIKFLLVLWGKWPILRLIYYGVCCAKKMYIFRYMAHFVVV